MAKGKTIFATIIILLFISSVIAITSEKDEEIKDYIESKLKEKYKKDKPISNLHYLVKGKVNIVEFETEDGKMKVITTKGG